MNFKLSTVIALLVTVVLSGCVNKLDTIAGKEFNEKNQAKVTAAFDQIKLKMSEKQVAKILGKPARIVNYKPAPTMKIPARLDADTGREIWYYPGSGLITFKIDTYTRRYKVVNILKSATAQPQTAKTGEN